MRILLFDIDGTLLLTNRGGQNALSLAFTQEFGLQRVFTDVRFSGRTDRALITELLHLNGLASDEANVQRLRRRYAATLPAVLAQRGGRLLPGVPELLERLAGIAELRSFVMTGNLPETAALKLKHFDLAHAFEGIFGGDLDHHRDDLARRSATALRERYDLQSPVDAVVIGDTPADIRCGHAIGARVIAVCTGSFSRAELAAENPMAIEDDLSDVDRLVDLMMQP